MTCVCFVLWCHFVHHPLPILHSCLLLGKHSSSTSICSDKPCYIAPGICGHVMQHLIRTFHIPDYSDWFRYKHIVQVNPMRTSLRPLADAKGKMQCWSGWWLSLSSQWRFISEKWRSYREKRMQQMAKRRQKQRDNQRKRDTEVLMPAVSKQDHFLWISQLCEQSNSFAGLNKLWMEVLWFEQLES